MKTPIKSIGALALLASSTSAFAIAPPFPQKPPKVACIEITTTESGASYADDCDQTANNKKLNKELNKDTGCAVNQARFASRTVKIPSCMPIGMVQL